MITLSIFHCSENVWFLPIIQPRPISKSVWIDFAFSLFFWLDFGLCWLTSLQFIQYHIAGFYKQTIPQSPPSHLRDYSTCNKARLEFFTIFVPSFDPNEWYLKNDLDSGGLNPGPLGHESSALTTRPRLLAIETSICSWHRLMTLLWARPFCISNFLEFCYNWSG